MFEKLFKLKEHNTTVKTEVLAGLTTFLAMAYILALNPQILGTVMDKSGVFVATAVASAVATFIMAFLANYPIALSAGLGLNAYFAYTVCLGELKKNRFEPAHQFALILSRETCGACLEFSPGDRALASFLAGGTVRFDGTEAQRQGGAGAPVPGWNLVLAGRFPVGWGKYADGVLKNKIPQSWRIEP